MSMFLFCFTKILFLPLQPKNEISPNEEPAVKEGRSNLNVSKRVRRKRVPDKADYPLNLWSIVKNCIGKDLTKIPMPVNFSEPLSMLQRLTEDFEYSDILDQAAASPDSCQQLAYVAAFTVSSYANTCVRTFILSDLFMHCRNVN